MPPKWTKKDTSYRAILLYILKNFIVLKTQWHFWQQLRVQRAIRVCGPRAQIPILIDTKFDWSNYELLKVWLAFMGSSLELVNVREPLFSSQ
jgi:hypothetical protein